MAIEQNDGILTKFGKPTDVKTYVGTQANFEYTTKEEIPSNYLFPGMEVKEYKESTWKRYKLDNGLTVWTEILDSDNSLNIQQSGFTATIDNITLDPDGHTYILVNVENQLNNSLLIINGVVLTNGDATTYDMSDVQVTSKGGDDPPVSYLATKIDIVYHIEYGDYVSVLKF